MLRTRRVENPEETRLTPPNGSSSPTVVRRVEVLNSLGLHARPAARIAQTVKDFDAEVALVLIEAPVDMGVPSGTRVDAASVMDILFLAAPAGTKLDIEADGAQAEEAADALVALFEDQFGVVEG